MNEEEIAIYEDARNMANIAVWGVELQIQRLRQTENEIKEFVMQPVIDFHFLVTALSRLRVSADLVSRICDLTIEVEKFDRSLPDLRVIRNILEHIDDYRVGKGHNKNVPKDSFQSILFGNDSIRWVGYEINLETAVKSSSELFMAIKSKLPNE